MSTEMKGPTKTECLRRPNIRRDGSSKRSETKHAPMMFLCKIEKKGRIPWNKGRLQKPSQMSDVVKVLRFQFYFFLIGEGEAYMKVVLYFFKQIIKSRNPTLSEL